MVQDALGPEPFIPYYRLRRRNGTEFSMPGTFRDGPYCDKGGKIVVWP